MRGATRVSELELLEADDSDTAASQPISGCGTKSTQSNDRNFGNLGVGHAANANRNDR